MNLEWNVFYHNINNNKIETFNIFNHWKFDEDVQKSLKKFKDKNEFAEQLRRDLMYYFWSKCEYEVVITSFPPYITMDELDRLNHERWSHKDRYGTDYVRINVNPDTGAKIDIYTQVMNNWDIFLDYVWNSKIHRPKRIKASVMPKENIAPREKCDTCMLRYVCEEQAEYECKQRNYSDYRPESTKK